MIPFWVRSALAFGALTSSAVIALGFSQAFQTYHTGLDARRAILKVRADEVRNDVVTYLNTVRRQMRSVAQLPWGEPGWLTRSDLDNEIERLLQLMPQAAFLFVCDASGQAIVAKARNFTTIPPTYLDCVSPGESAQIDRSDTDRPTGRVSVPAPEFGESSRLIVSIDMRALALSLGHSLASAGGVERVVVDEHGRAALHIDPLNVLGEGKSYDLSDVRLKGWLIEAVPIQGSSWSVLAMQSRDSIEADVWRSTVPVVVVLVFSWGAAVLVSTYLARRISQPISDIAHGVETFASGDLSARVSVRDRGEVGRLATRFNIMADSIQRSQEHLEEQVSVRTQELAVANAELAEWSEELEGRVEEKLREVERLSELKRFFSPRLAESLLADDRGLVLQSHRREATVMFVDLRGFTAFAEAAPAERVMAVLREFHAEAGRLIFEFEGTLERFTGDGMMVFFNDPDPMPDHAGRAVALACRLRDRAAALMQGWQSAGAGPSGVGIGLSLGQATIGPIGFESRVDYAAIGTVTNRAARLCAEAAAGEVLICWALHDRLQGRLRLGAIRQVQLKGMQAPETCYTVQAIDPLPTSAPAAAG